MRSTRPFPRFIAAGIVLIALVGCGTKSRGPSSAGAGGATTVAGQLFPDNFTSVCQGATQSRAHAYLSTGPHKMLYIQTYQDQLQDTSEVLPSDWTVQFNAKTDAYAAVDLVACGVRTGSAYVKECSGYLVNGKDGGQKVKLYTATYKITVKEAKTGNVLGSTILQANNTDCPTSHLFDAGQKVATVYQDPTTDALVAFLKPYAQP